MTYYLKAPFKWLWALNVKAWNYSRIIYINASAILAAIFPDLINYLMGFEWDAFFQHEIAIMLGLFVNIISITLRLNTFTPVGATPQERAAIKDVIVQQKETAGEAVTANAAVDLDVGTAPVEQEAETLSPKAD